MIMHTSLKETSFLSMACFSVLHAKTFSSRFDPMAVYSSSNVKAAKACPLTSEIDSIRLVCSIAKHFKQVLIEKYLGSRKAVAN